MAGSSTDLESISLSWWSRSIEEVVVSDIAVSRAVGGADRRDADGSRLLTNASSWDISDEGAGKDI